VFVYIHLLKTIIYRSRGQNLSVHDDFMMPIMLELGVCLHTFIDHEVKMCLLMFILVFTSLTVFVYIHLLIMIMRFHDEPVTAYLA
jgi:hypothetical protein